MIWWCHRTNQFGDRLTEKPESLKSVCLIWVAEPDTSDLSRPTSLLNSITGARRSGSQIGDRSTRGTKYLHVATDLVTNLLTVVNGDFLVNYPHGTVANRATAFLSTRANSSRVARIWGGWRTLVTTLTERNTSVPLVMSGLSRIQSQGRKVSGERILQKLPPGTRWSQQTAQTGGHACSPKSTRPQKNTSLVNRDVI